MTERMGYSMKILPLYELVLIGMGVLAFALYGVDKFKAVHQMWRIPERVLLGAGLLGGAAGALIGMKIFHHKTRRWYFWAVNLAGLLIQMRLLAYLKGYLT